MSLRRVTVIGAGTWGTTVGSISALRASTVLLARRHRVADQITRRHENVEHLRGLSLSSDLRATTSASEALGDTELIIVAVPCPVVREILTEVEAWIPRGTPVVSLAKGLEPGTGKRMTEVIASVVPESPTGVLTGPTLAREVLAGRPTAAVVAMADIPLAGEIQDLLAQSFFRLYTNPDVVGCELAGAAKNVLAIAAGVSDGLGLGDSTKAALVTRGLAELERLGLALGGDRRTFAGLAGLGDLVVTCSSRHSRNRFVGEQMGRGRQISDILSETPLVAEGVTSARPLHQLASQYGVVMPIVAQVVEILEGRRTAGEAMEELVARPVGVEPQITTA